MHHQSVHSSSFWELELDSFSKVSLSWRSTSPCGNNPGILIPTALARACNARSFICPYEGPIYSVREQNPELSLDPSAEIGLVLMY